MAQRSDPISNVMAPDSFKEQHYTEHVTHTQLPPRAALSLAASLENESFKGGRGAELFQRRKARSEKWVVDDSTVKNNDKPIVNKVISNYLVYTRFIIKFFFNF